MNYWLRWCGGNRNQWHVIPQPPGTLHGTATWQGAATWWIHCHDSRVTCHIAGCKNSIRRIENRFRHILFHFFLFLMQFRLWRAAAFVLSPIHLFCLRHCEAVWREVLLMSVEHDDDSVFDEANISSAQQILNQGAGNKRHTYTWRQNTFNAWHLNATAPIEICV